jgi:hypothetical protein
MASEHDELWPHAFHLNLPSHHIDEDGIPYVSKFAQEKARNIMTLVHSIQLNESLYVNASNDVNEEEEEEEDEEEEEEDVHALPKAYTMVSSLSPSQRFVALTLQHLTNLFFHCCIRLQSQRSVHACSRSSQRWKV